MTTHPTTRPCPRWLAIAAGLFCFFAAWTASAQSVLVAELKSDYAPGTEVASVRVDVRAPARGWSASELAPVFTTDDLLSGIRVAEFRDAPDESEVYLSLDLLDSAGETVHFYSTHFWHSIPEIYLFSVSRHGGRVGGERSYWTTATHTDAALGVACADGYAADGLRCRDGYCATVSLHCKRTPGTLGNRTFLPPISEETPGNTAFCPAFTNSLVTTIGCSGSNCDDVTIGCDELDAAPYTPCTDPFMSFPISEESSVPFDPTTRSSFQHPNRGCFMRTVSCFGDYCDDKVMTFERVSAGPIRAQEGFDSDGLCITLGLASPYADRCSNADGPVLNGHLMHWRLNELGRLEHGLGETCIGVDQSGEEGLVSFVDCEEAAEQWQVDDWGLIHLIENPDACLGIDNGGAEGEEGELRVVACEDAQPWTLTQEEDPLTLKTPTLLISEYVEGSGVDDAIEITNLDGGLVDLAAYEIRIHRAAEADPILPSDTIPLEGLLAVGDSFVIAREDPGLDPNLAALADQLADGLVFDGADTILLVETRSALVVDSLGQLGASLPRFADATTSARDATLRRQSDVCAGDTDPMDPFLPSEEWDGFPVDAFDDLGTHSATCVPEPGVALGLVSGALVVGAIGRGQRRRS